MTKEKEQVKAEKEIKEEIAIQETEIEIKTGERVVDLPNLGEVVISFPSITIEFIRIFLICPNDMPIKTKMKNNVHNRLNNFSLHFKKKKNVLI